MNEDDRLVLRKHDVGSAGELFVQRPVHGETKPVAVEERPEQALGLGVLPRDPGHDPAAFFFVEDVRHGKTRVPRTGAFGKLGLRGKSHADTHAGHFGSGGL